VSRQPGHLLSGGQVPKPDGPVAARRSQPRAVGVKDGCEHLVGMPPQNSDAVARVQIPDAYGVVTAGRSQTIPVGTESDRIDRAGVTLESSHLLMRLRVPNSNRAEVVAGAG